MGIDEPPVAPTNDGVRSSLALRGFRQLRRRLTGDSSMYPAEQKRAASEHGFLLCIPLVALALSMVAFTLSMVACAPQEYRGFCAEQALCVGGNSKDEASCAQSLVTAAAVADAYECTPEYSDLWLCQSRNTQCEDEDGTSGDDDDYGYGYYYYDRPDYWTAGDDCVDEQFDYTECVWGSSDYYDVDDLSPPSSDDDSAMSMR